MNKLKEFLNNACSVFTAQDVIDVIDAIGDLTIVNAAGFDNLKAESIKFAHLFIVIC